MIIVPVVVKPAIEPKVPLHNSLVKMTFVELIVGPATKPTLNGPAVAVHPTLSVTVNVYAPCGSPVGFNTLPPEFVQA